MNDDQLKAMRWECPQRIPVSVWILPSAWMKYREKLNDIVSRYPAIFGESAGEMGNYDAMAQGTYVEGEHTDVWGCVWSNVKTGMEAIVTRHPVPTREAVHALAIPEKDAGMPHGFMYLRLADLRGFEEVMMDFAEEPPELQILIDKVLTYNLRQAKLLLAKTPEGEKMAYFGDDLGIQHSLPMSPDKWRRYLKPCYDKIYKIFKDAGMYVYMHTDGHIYEIIPDLIECGVNIVNPQVGANGLENLAAVCKRRVCVDLDLNRQMFPFWKPRDIENHVKEAVEILGLPEGGLWLKAEIADDIPLENVEAICAAMEKYSTYFS